MTETLPLHALRPSLNSLWGVYAQARHYVLCRERARALQRRAGEAPGSLAEAIERDFVAFELEDAERALCAAIRTAEGRPEAGEAPGCPSPPSGSRVS